MVTPRLFAAILLSGCVLPFFSPASRAQTTLIAPTDTWSYLCPSNGVDPAIADPDFNTTWHTFNGSYNGPAFAAGPGPFHYGGIDYFIDNSLPGTPIGVGGTTTAPPSGSRYSAYFKKQITLATACSDVQMSMLADDGALVYVDGSIRLRVNLTGSGDQPDNGTGDSYTMLSDDVLAEDELFPPYSIGALSAGTHTIAISLHNALATSSDLGLYVAFSCSTGPEIAMEQPAGTNLSNGRSRNFGAVTLGQNGTLVFTVENSGMMPLTGLGTSFTGADAADFSVTAAPAASVAAGGSTTFTVSFVPGDTGARTAVLHVASNDVDENPFDITLNGTGVAETVPTVVTMAATNVTSRGVTLNGTVNANNISSTMSFEHGLTTAYGASLLATPSSVAGTVTTPVSASLANLQPATTYHFRVRADYGGGSGVPGADLTFTTLPVGTGDVDAGFDAIISGPVNAVALQPDGKILHGDGSGIDRLLENGAPDPGFVPATSDGNIYEIVLQPDGKILIGGDFTAVNGVTRNRLARLHPDGSLDAGFAPAGLTVLAGLALQADGKILTAGTPRLARFHPDGTRDTAFMPVLNAIVYWVAVDTGGKILAGGDFTSPRSHVARFNADGSLDTGFNPPVVDDDIFVGAVQADGKILIAGFGVNRPFLSRLNANGSADASFNATLPEYVTSVVVQTDGKILAAGPLYLKRLHADGSRDAALDITCDSWVESVTIRPDGRILMGGYFSIVNGQPRTGIARLLNDPATSALTVPALNRVQWLRGGTAPQIPQAAFQLSTDSRQTWTHLGFGTRIAGGWELNNLTLPAAGDVRALASVPDGGASSGIALSTVSFGTQASPEIAVEESGGPVLTDGGTSAFGSVAIGANLTRTFVIRNTGAAPLMGVAAAVSGSHAADFTVTSPPAATVAPGGSTTFTLRFAPQAADARAAGLQIASNDADENSFDLICTGNGFVALVPAVVTMEATNITSHSATLNGTVNANNISSAMSFEHGFTTAYGAAVPAAPSPVTGTVTTSVSASLANLQPSTTYHFRVRADYTGGSWVPGADLTFTTLPLGPGDLDLSFSPPQFGPATFTVVQPDGKILYVTQQFLRRVQANGTPDPGFSPPPVNSWIQSLLVQPNGKIVIGGLFTQVNNVTWNKLARLNPDGTQDTGFNHAGFADVWAMALQADGKFLVAGDPPLTRFNPDGSRDGSLQHVINGPVSWAAVQTDGKILVSGDFTSPRARLARLHPDGSLDTSFNPPALSDSLGSGVVQADGKILLGRSPAFLRLNPDGSPDTGFNTAPRSPHTMAVQTDGKILATGHNFFVRLNSDGSPDPTVDVTVDRGLDGMAVQPDGGILLATYEANIKVNGVTQSHIFRLRNGPATESLTVSFPNRVQWLRGGTSPEIPQVVFQLSTDDRQTWTHLGFGTRIAGGWELNNLTLPPVGDVRAVAAVPDGGGSSGLTMSTVSFGSPVSPEIAVEETGGPGLTDGGSSAFGSVPVGGNASRTFTIRNTGTSPLSGVAATVSGTHASDFTVITPPAATVQPGAATIFTLRFAPGVLGARTAALQIAGNDADESPFDINLSGTGAPGTPVLTTQAAAGVTGSAATLHGTVNAYGQNTSVSFEYGPTASYGSTATATPALVAGDTAAVQVTLAGLTPNAVYHYRVTGSWSSGSGTGADQTFTTLPPGPGDLDLTFAPADTDGQVRATALQADGKIIVGGTFQSVGGKPAKYICRLLADGTMDDSFHPVPDNIVESLAVLPDGKILVGGWFTQINGQSGKLIRLNPDGSVDRAMAHGSTVYGVWPLPDGNLLVGGSNKVIRVHPDGTEDPGFSASFNDTVRCLSVQADGKIIVGGGFTAGNAYLVRLNTNGSRDTSFNPVVPATVYSVAVQEDGRVLASGPFTGMGPSALLRYLPGGALDTSFNPAVDQTVLAIVVQTDGKLLLGGGFANPGGVPARFVVRLNADGTRDPGLNLDTSLAGGGVYSISLQPDGGIILGGYFTTVNGFPRQGLARVLTNNGPASESLTKTSPARLQWLRGGVVPQVQQAVFEISSDGRHTWSSLGTGTRISGGWELTGLTLPANADVRAWGFIPTHGTGGSLALASLSFGAPVVPEINVEYPALTTLPAGGTLDFGPVSAGVPASRTLTIKNIGNGGILTGLSASLTGPGAGAFSITTPPPSQLTAGAGTPLTVRLLPVSGTHTAILRILSNDTDENPYDINLTAIVATPEIVVHQPFGTNVPDGGPGVNFGNVNAGGTASLTFTVFNSGQGVLSGLQLSTDGPDAARFTISTTPAATVEGGDSTTFTVTYSPQSSGAHSATLHLANNDADENPFDIALTGTSLAPEIEVEQPAGTPLVNGSAAVDFGSAAIGAGAVRTFTIRNSGPSALTNLAVTKNGTQAALFTITGPAVATLAPGASTTFDVTFTPAAAGLRTAALQIASNDADENPFQVSLLGNGLAASPLDTWRQTWFGTIANTGSAADLADPDGDGTVNLIEFATGTNPTAASPPPGQLVKNGNTLEFTFTRPKAALTEVTYMLEAADSPTAGWSTTGTALTILADDGVTQHIKITAPAPAGTVKRLVRLRISRL